MGQASDLFISEYSNSNSPFNNWIELYNGTAGAINLADYGVLRHGNGGYCSSPADTLFLSGTLAPNTTYLIALSNNGIPAIANNADTLVPFPTGAWQTMAYNGAVAISLAKNSGGSWSTIDVVGGCTGTGPWPVGATANGTQLHVLVRQTSVCGPDTSWNATVSGQWNVFPVNTTTDAGQHSMICAPPPAMNVTGLHVASPTSVLVGFSQAVDMTSAQNAANYTITGLTVGSASVIAADSVELTLATAFGTGLYPVNIQNVLDNANMVAMTPYDTSLAINSYTGSDLLISEIFYNEGGASGDLEYLELHNKGANMLDLVGARFTEGIDHFFDSTLVLNAGMYAIAAGNEADFNATFSPAMASAQWDGGSLSNSGEDLLLVNTWGDTILYQEYDDREPWDSRADGDGYSIALCDPNSDPNIAGNWFIQSSVAGTSGGVTLFGTPGAANMCATAPLYSIQTITTVDANGETDSLDVVCRIRGIVAGRNVSETGASGPDVEFAVINATNTEGIWAISFANEGELNYVPTMGDSVEIRGIVDQFSGLTQFNIQRVDVLSTGTCMPLPQVADAPSESVEGELVELRNVTLVTNSWIPTAGTGRNFQVVTPMSDTVTLRVRLATNDIDSTFMAGINGAFNITAIGGQFDGSSPYDEGYQLIPRTTADFDFDLTKPAPAGLVWNEIMPDNNSVYADNQGDFDTWVEVYNGGNAPVDLAGYYVSNDPANPMQYRIPNCSMNTVVTNGGWNVIWADDEDEEGALHTNFTLPVQDGFIGLYTPDGSTLVDTIRYDSVRTDFSWGRDGDGNPAWILFSGSTPNASNNNGTPYVNSVDELEGKRSLHLWPNPVSGNEIQFNEVVDVRVFDLQGKHILTRPQVQRLDVSGLARGMYLIRVEGYEPVKLIRQ
ncbi:MAG: T9SS type A sorting domain-containing protein [Leptolyngbya sp. SIO3F4]|nr:T9SS type A sorting domain-containing protein [Leptolyngbya sp. SIO3F4]